MSTTFWTVCPTISIIASFAMLRLQIKAIFHTVTRVRCKVKISQQWDGKMRGAQWVMEKRGSKIVLQESFLKDTPHVSEAFISVNLSSSRCKPSRLNNILPKAHSRFISLLHSIGVIKSYAMSSAKKSIIYSLSMPFIHFPLSPQVTVQGWQSVTIYLIIKLHVRNKIK